MPRKPEYGGYLSCYQCHQHRERYGKALSDLIPITYTVSNWPLGTGLREWKDEFSANPTAPMARAIGAIWSAYLECQVPRIEPGAGGFDVITAVPSSRPTVTSALQAAEASGWWVPELTTVASADPEFQRQRERDPKDRPVIEGKWSVEAELVYDKDILALDDLTTSGGTLHSFARALLDAGAHRVTAVALARNLGRGDGEWILPLLRAEHEAGRVWTPQENKHDILS